MKLDVDTRMYAQTGGPQTWIGPTQPESKPLLFGNQVRWAWSVLREVWRTHGKP